LIEGNIEVGEEKMYFWNQGLHPNAIHCHVIVSRRKIPSEVRQSWHPEVSLVILPPDMLEHAE